jgi:hypothetical protein
LQSQIDLSEKIAEFLRISPNDPEYANFIAHNVEMLQWSMNVAISGSVGIKTTPSAANGVSVYTSTTNGATSYVGITNNIARRGAEHLATKGISIAPLMKSLNRAEARAVEQALIEIHGLSKTGGTLINKINSIAVSNPTYASAIELGYKLLKSIGYK